MEIAKVEIAAVEKAAHEADFALKALDELELSLVGGGMGDIIL